MTMTSREMKKYRGTVMAQGIAFGKSHVFESSVQKVDCRYIGEEEVAEALKLLDDATVYANAEIERALGGKDMDEECAAILETHQLILQDPETTDEIKDEIATRKKNVQWAIQSVYSNYISALEDSDDQLIRERVADIKDVCARLIRCSLKKPENELLKIEEPCILIAKDLFTSDTVAINPALVKGIVTEKGGVTSHSAIIARSYGIPAVCGIADATELFPQGTNLIVDAIQGMVIANPDGAVEAEYSEKWKKNAKKIQATQKYLKQNVLTKDNVKIEVELNLGTLDVISADTAAYVDGVGLFRTEFLYMEKKELPTEQEQYEAYKYVLETFKGKPVILRTLDIGGDKQLAYFKLPEENNPFLGKRALRLCLEHKDIFKTQLRAAYRASVYGDLRLMFPMVGSIDDIESAKQVVEEVKTELRREKAAFREDVKIGIMIEVPAIAMTADIAAQKVDFASIGTNDLCQYLTAADRLNPDMAPYYQCFHPAMFRIIKIVADAFISNNKPIGVCGEMSGDPRYAAALIGLGIRRLSMNQSGLAQIKQLIANVDTNEMAKAAKAVLNLPHADEVERYLESAVGCIDKE